MGPLLELLTEVADPQYKKLPLKVSLPSTERNQTEIFHLACTGSKRIPRTHKVTRQCTQHVMQKSGVLRDPFSLNFRSPSYRLSHRYYQSANGKFSPDCQDISESLFIEHPEPVVSVIVIRWQRGSCQRDARSVSEWDAA